MVCCGALSGSPVDKNNCHWICWGSDIVCNWIHLACITYIHIITYVILMISVYNYTIANCYCIHNCHSYQLYPSTYRRDIFSHPSPVTDKRHKIRKSVKGFCELPTGVMSRYSLWNLCIRFFDL